MSDSHALRAARRLVDHDAAVRERNAHARLAGCKQEAAHRRRLTDAHGRNLGADVCHRVVDREAGSDHAARRVDVHEDVLLRVLGLEEEQLGGDERGHVILDRVR